jgi:hypothetical protein
LLITDRILRGAHCITIRLLALAIWRQTLAPLALMLPNRVSTRPARPRGPGNRPDWRRSTPTSKALAHDDLDRHANARDRKDDVAYSGARTACLSKQKRRALDIEYKISRAMVNWAEERQVSTLVIGDVRDVADGKRLNTKSQQKIGLWSHGRQRAYITSRA